MADGLVHDVVIVGGSLAGCSAARLFAQQGLRVLLLEKHADPNRHKPICTHYIQACAVPVIRRLNLEPSLHAAGCVRSRIEMWTRYGWVRHGGDSNPETYGYNIRRQTLDPIVRRLAMETPGVETMLGTIVEDVIRDDGRIVGVRLRGPGGKIEERFARMVVGADGRDSTMARYAGIASRSDKNQRFTCLAYYKNLPLASGNDSQFWMLDPDAAYALPNEQGITLVSIWLTKDKLLEFKQDRVAAFEKYICSIPERPRFEQAERISNVILGLDYPMQYRAASKNGLALIGDAAFAADPLWGVGCGWAFQSAGWLVDHTAAALKAKIGLDHALERYRKYHYQSLAGHRWIMTDVARSLRFPPIMRAFLYAAARDSELSNLLLDFGARRVGVTRFLSPRVTGRLVLKNLGRVWPFNSGQRTQS